MLEAEGLSLLKKEAEAWLYKTVAATKSEAFGTVCVCLHLSLLLRADYRSR